MPYTILTMPSVGLAQIQAVVRASLDDQVKIDTAYCYIDFAEFLGGLGEYNLLGTYETKGLVEWMFRDTAFAAPGNIDSYRRFFSAGGDFPGKRKVFALAEHTRAGIGQFLDNLVRRYRLTDYDVVGFTSMMSQNVASFALARRLKELHPSVITCMGGANTEHPMGKTIVQHVASIDYAFSGEALVNFPAFLQAVIAHDHPAIASLRGVHARSGIELKKAVGYSGPMLANIPIRVESLQVGGCGTSELEANSGETFNLNELPTLDYTEYLDRIEQASFRDKVRSELILPFQTSTGCWWADKVPCSFCGLTPHAFRQMTASKARKYITELIDRYKDKFWVFEATDPCMPVEYPKEVFAHINQDKGAILQYEVKAMMPVEDLAEMAKANVILPQPGIESLSTRTLKIMRKGVTAFHNVKFLKDCTEQGLYPIWNYLYGFPNRDYDELDSDKLAQDIRTLCHLPPPSSFMPINFPRYSEYFNEGERYGLQLRPLSGYFHVYPFSEEVVAEIAYFFVDQEYNRRFTERYAAAVSAIRMEIVEWIYKFRLGVPRLCFEGEDTIRDTRSGRAVLHKVDRMRRELLKILNEPKTVEEAAKKLQQPVQTTQTLIEEFVRSGFLFSERGKHFNIVCERCALTADVYKDYYVNFLKSSSTGFE